MELRRWPDPLASVSDVRYLNVSLFDINVSDSSLFRPGDEGDYYAGVYLDMPAGQDKIYYAAGESRDRLAKMPVVKSALDHGYDVLLCTQDVDEFMTMACTWSRSTSAMRPMMRRRRTVSRAVPVPKTWPRGRLRLR